MFKRLFSGKPNPEVQALLKLLIPPEVGEVTDEALEEASRPRGKGMLNLLGFGGYSFMDAMMGQTEIKGLRCGREVSISFGTTLIGGKPTVTTHVAVAAIPFEVSFKDRNLESMGLPPGVAAVLDKLGPLDKDVQIEGTSSGITVKRKRSSRDAASWKGTVQWLNDMRLAESLADGFSSS